MSDFKNKLLLLNKHSGPTSFDVVAAVRRATGIKRVLPDRVVFTYQGDGDLAAIGTAETIHAANRGENITLIIVEQVTKSVPRKD